MFKLVSISMSLQTYLTCIWTNMATTLQIWVTKPLCAKTQPTAMSTSHVISMHASEAKMHSNTSHMPHILISSCAHMRQLCQYICLNELTAINSVTRNTGTCIFILVAWTSEPNMPTTLHINLPLHCYCSLQIESTWLHKSVKNHILQHLFTILLPYICQQHICSLNAIFMPYVQITWCPSVVEVRKYMSWIWTFCHHWCGQKHWYRGRRTTGRLHSSIA